MPINTPRLVHSTFRRLIRDVISNNSVLNVGAFVRKDLYNYFPSGNPLADLGPANLQTSSIAQIRTLMNAAIHSDLTYTRGVHNIKAGVQYGQTFLRENDSLGIVDPTYHSTRPASMSTGIPPLDSTRSSIMPLWRKSELRCGAGALRPDPGWKFL